MLSIFPELLDFSFFTPTLLRLTVGFIFLISGYASMFPRRDRVAACLETFGLRPGWLFAASEGLLGVLGGVLLIFGLWTQVAAIVLAALSLASFVMKLKGAKALNNSASFYFLLFIVCVTLVFTGAGAIAIDYPL